MEINIEHLTKVYGEQKAIDNISFQLHKGEVLGFLGPNGAGKSTTMKIISCFMAPTSGDVKADNQSIFEDTGTFKTKIGYLPENTPLYPEMQMIDYLDFIARLQGVPQREIPGRINEMVEYCGLKSEKHKKIEELSKGFRQRVGLAQALIHDPEVLILDEPTTGLDPNQIIEIRKLIRNLGKEKTILLSTHILPEVEATCNRILIINKGNIVADKTSEALISQGEGRTLLSVQVEANNAINEVARSFRSIDSVTDLEVLD